MLTATVNGKVNKFIDHMPSKGYVHRVLDTAAIKERREGRGLTMEAAALAAGFKSKQHWYAVESGSSGGEKGISLGTLDAVAKALDCDPRDLLTAPPK